jgi:cysteine desulfurase/selenocysteine lyase
MASDTAIFEDKQGFSTFEIQKLRRDFPILSQRVHGKPLVYLDNAATTQKPQAVLEAVMRFYMTECSNIHRGVHSLSQRATEDYEHARETVRRFINAKDSREIIFVRGATEGVNLVAQTFGRARVHAGDEIIISAMEHHSNIVPWQMLCEEKGATLRIAPINERGALILEALDHLIGPRTRLLAVTHVSNALGTVNPVESIIELAHSRNVPVLLDGAQAVQHLPVDVQRLNCDFYVFSGHKIYGPTGVGVLHGKSELLEAMQPYQGGGDMISSVTFEKTIYNKIPHKFEAGTPNIAGGIGLGTALEYVSSIGLSRIVSYECELLAYATEAVEKIPGVRVIGTAPDKASVLSFTIDGIHPHDIGTVLDQEGIAIRTGHHCAQPVMDFFKIPATARASLAFYNTREEIDALIAGIRKVKEVFS